MFQFNPSPLQRLRHPIAEAAGIEWWIKRDDLFGPGGKDIALQGNKIRKLSGYLTSWHDLSDPALRILSFGGAYSNHLVALSVAGRRYGFKTIGFVRGETVDNPVLSICRNNGMELRFVSRSEYRLKSQPEKLLEYRAKFGPVIIIPEGGSGPDSKLGTKEIFPEIERQLGTNQPVDFFQLAAGTGGTAAGIIDGMEGKKQPLIEVFPVLKGGWMGQEIEKQLARPIREDQWRIIDGHHWGGYAKLARVLLDFCTGFSQHFNITLEPVYTGKLFHALLQRIEAGFYPPKSRLVTYHSGGIFNEATSE